MKKSKRLLGIAAAWLIGAGSLFSGAVVAGTLQQEMIEASVWRGWYGRTHVQFQGTDEKNIEKKFDFYFKLTEIDPQIYSQVKGDAGVESDKRGNIWSTNKYGFTDTCMACLTINTTYIMNDFKVPDGYEAPNEIKFKIDANKNVIILNDEGKDILSVKKSEIGSHGITPKANGGYNGFYIKIYRKGEAKNGWKNENGGWKYYKNGVAYKGWHKMGKVEGEKTEHWSYFGSDGKLYTGWKNMGKNEGEKTAHWSYFGDNGWLRTGWQQMGKGTNNPDGNAKKHWSYFGGNGWLRTGWQWMDKSQGEKTPNWSYFGGNGWLRTGMVTLGKADGEKVTHKSYFGSNGWLVTNKRFSVAGKTYTADSRGWIK